MRRSDGFHKVGHSSEPLRRMFQVQYTVKQDVVIVHQAFRSTGDQHAIEQLVHEMLCAYWVTGEWFDVAEATAVETISFACRMADIAILQSKRRQQLDEIESAIGRSLTRSEIIARELAGEFGEQWRAARTWLHQGYGAAPLEQDTGEATS